MLGQYFYNESIRKTIVAFGSLFNDIYIERKDSAGTAVQTLKVPLAYGCLLYTSPSPRDS